MWENVFHLVLVSFSAINPVVISEINCIMYQDYISSSVKHFSSRVCNISLKSLKLRYSNISSISSVVSSSSCMFKFLWSTPNTWLSDQNQLIIMVLGGFLKISFAPTSPNLIFNNCFWLSFYQANKYHLYFVCSIKYQLLTCWSIVPRGEGCYKGCKPTSSPFSNLKKK